MWSIGNPGVEPEPFELGEHLVTASDKLVVVDQLLAFLRPLGHKVLIFSQMTRVLDILQDYLGYRGTFALCINLHLLSNKWELFLDQEFSSCKDGRQSRALNNTPSQSYRMSLAVWDHTVLPATGHK